MAWTFQQLIREYPVGVRTCHLDAVLTDVAYDSRRVRPGSLFVCIRGRKTDGHLYFEEAVRRGAAAILVESVQAVPQAYWQAFPWAQVEDAREALGFACQRLWGWPAEQLQLVTCIGESGRETYARLAFELDRICADPRRSGVLYRMNLAWETLDHQLEMVYTSRSVPQAREYATGLATLVQAGVKRAYLPLSRESLNLKRAAWMRPTYVLIGDWQPEETELAAVKTLLQGAEGVVLARETTSSKGFEVLYHWAKAHHKRVITYGSHPQADVRLIEVQPQAGEGLGLRLKWAFKGQVQQPLQLRLATRFLVRGLLAWMALALLEQQPAPLEGELGANEVFAAAGQPHSVCHSDACAPAAAHSTLSLDPDTLARLKTLSRAAQAVQLPDHAQAWISPQGHRYLLDGAWRPEQLAHLLADVRPFVQPGGRLHLVYGSGGGRPEADRLAQGAACARGADYSWLTVSQPRNEDPHQIVQALLQGHATVAPDRASAYPTRLEALSACAAQLKPADLCVVAGLGEEGYQIDQHTLDFTTDRERLEQIYAPSHPREVS